MLKLEYSVQLCERREIKNFIEEWHYSKSINGLNISHCFKLVNLQNEIVGACIFGSIAMASVYKKYCENESDLIELRRLCCIDNTPKNTESYFIGHCLRWLKKNTNIKYVISYADTHYGHEGVIYKASNFSFVGKTAKSRVINFDGKYYHDKAIRTKNKGVLKPFAVRVKEALESGQAHYEIRPSKNIYLYRLEDNENFRKGKVTNV